MGERFLTKAQARVHFAAVRADIAAHPLEKTALDTGIIKAVSDLPEYASADVILAYYPVRDEIDLRPLFRLAAQDGKTLGLPVCAGGVMTFHTYTGKTLPGAYGIPHPTGDVIKPTENTLCILPGYACDGAHNRLGYGGGYYDRFLCGFPGVSAGAFYSVCTNAAFPVEEHDIPFSLLVTEKGLA